MSDWELGAGFIAGNNGSAASEDAKLIVYFHWDAVEVPSKTEDGVPTFKDVEFVEIRQPGQKDPLYHGPVKEAHKNRFRSRYDAWKATRENPVEGLPLSEWPLITKAKVKELEARGIRTVQELANVSDSVLPSLMLFGTQTRQKARDWLAEGQKGAVTATLRKEIDDLKAAKEFADKRVAFLESEVQRLSLQPQAQAPQVPAVDIAALIQAEISKALGAKEEKKASSKKKEVTE